MKALHFMLGLSVLFLMGLRIYAKLTGYTPAISLPLPAWQRIFSKSIHGLLYLFMISMPILGWLILSAAGKPIPFFGLSLPALMHKNVDNENLYTNHWFVWLLFNCLAYWRRALSPSH